MPEPPGDPMPWKRRHRTDPRRYLDHLAHLLGRRGVILLGVGITWTVLGVNEAFTHTDHLALAAGWVVTGLVAAAHCTRRPGKDAIAWLSAYIMPAIQVLVFSAQFLLWLAPLGDVGDWRPILGAILWLLIIGVLLVIAGWDEAKPRPEQEGR